MSTCGSFGSYTKVLVEPKGSPTTFDASSERYNILAETLSVKKFLQGRRQIVGDLSTYDGALRGKTYLVTGALVMNASPKNLHAWLPRALWNAPGTSGGASTYTIGNSPNDFLFDVLVSRENATFRYTDCRVARLVLRSETAAAQEENEELVELIVYIMGVDEDPDAADDWPDPEPALQLTGAYVPYAHWETSGAFQLDSNVTSYDEFNLDINNKLYPLFRNSKTPGCFRSTGREITLGMRTPLNSTTIAMANDIHDVGEAAQFVFTHTATPGCSMTINIPRVRNMYETPVTRNKGEIPMQLNLEATRIDGATPEINIINDHTPT
jgi:hypothetical protein